MLKKYITSRATAYLFIFVSVLNIFLLGISERWISSAQKFLTEVFIHLFIILALIAFFYFSVKVDKKMWFTKYILSAFLLCLILIYNLLLLFVLFSGSSDAPYSVAVIFSLIYIFPIAGVLTILSLIERYIKNKSL